MTTDFSAIKASVIGDKKTRLITVVRVEHNVHAGPPKLLVFKGRRFRIMILSIVMVIFFGITLFGYFNHGPHGHWTVLLAPIGLFGLIGLFLPDSEQWEYRPWQSQSQQVEQITYD